MTEPTTDEPELPRPALPILLDQQRELIDHRQGPTTGLEASLRPGFTSRRDAIRWYQAAIVRSFGRITERWRPDSLIKDRTILQALIVSDRRLVWTSDDPIDDEVATRLRRKLEDHAVRPAFQAAYDELRKQAGEYIGQDDGSEVDPERQEIAMRPGFSRKDLEQRQTLARLWDGFEDIDKLRDWLHDLSQPTNGALGREWGQRVVSDRVSVSYLLRGQADARESQRYREWLAVVYLLPAFQQGIARMDTGELAKRTRQGLEVTPA